MQHAGRCHSRSRAAGADRSERIRSTAKQYVSCHFRFPRERFARVVAVPADVLNRGVARAARCRGSCLVQLLPASDLFALQLVPAPRPRGPRDRHIGRQQLARRSSSRSRPGIAHVRMAVRTLSTSSGSTRKPRILTWWSTRPRHSSVPSPPAADIAGTVGVHRRKSPGRYRVGRKLAGCAPGCASNPAPTPIPRGRSRRGPRPAHAPARSSTWTVILSSGGRSARTAVPSDAAPAGRAGTRHRPPRSDHRHSRAGCPATPRSSARPAPG